MDKLMTQWKLKEETLVYKEWPGGRLDMTVIRPAEEKGEAPLRPALMWIHGGGWRNGTPDLFLEHCRYFAARGMVCCTVRYRLLAAANGHCSGEGHAVADRVSAAAAKATPAAPVTIDDCLEDCRAAVRYLKTHWQELGLDPARIAVGGDSAGGHLAVSLGTLPEPSLAASAGAGEDGTVSARPALIIDCNGIVDMAQIRWRSVAGEGLPQPEDRNSAAYLDYWRELNRRARRWSPLYHVAPGQPPHLLLHGLNDETVTPEESVAYCEAQKKAGNEVELALFPGMRHAFILYGYSATKEQTDQAMGVIEDYLLRKGMLPGASSSD